MAAMKPPAMLAKLTVTIPAADALPPPPPLAAVVVLPLPLPPLPLLPEPLPLLPEPFPELPPPVLPPEPPVATAVLLELELELDSSSSLTGVVVRAGVLEVEAGVRRRVVVEVALVVGASDVGSSSSPASTDEVGREPPIMVVLGSGASPRQRLPMGQQP